MIRLEIDNITIEAKEGSYLIEAARTNGIDIPSLCHNNEFEHYSSCMVCMVRDMNSNRFIPSCSVIVEAEMKIDATSEDVLNIRSKAIELLLSEHRAECEAPCKLVCPVELDIPKMNRLISSNRIEEVANLIYKDMGMPRTLCHICPAFCENACRRKKIDKQISIRSLVTLIAGNRPDNNIPDARKRSSNGKKIAVIGSGPAGLSASYQLYIAGYECVLFEKNKELGGTLAGNVKSNILPGEILKAEIEIILKSGISVITNRNISSKEITDSLSNEFDLIINASGSRFDIERSDDKISGFVSEGDCSSVNNKFLISIGSAYKQQMSGVRCYRNGKKVSEAIDRYFSSGEALPGYRPFNSTLGRVNDEEWNEWLKECSPGASRHEDPINIEEAESEAGNCMHCDCRAAGNCDLRNLSESLNINNPKLKLIGPAAEKKINANNGLVFENAKCIKCGLCVRLGSKQANVPSLCFKGRGFESLISEPLYYDFNDIASGMARDLTDICPTGALSLIDL